MILHLKKGQSGSVWAALSKAPGKHPAAEPTEPALTEFTPGLGKEAQTQTFSCRTSIYGKEWCR